MSNFMLFLLVGVWIFVIALLNGIADVLNEKGYLKDLLETTTDEAMFEVAIIVWPVSIPVTIVCYIFKLVAYPVVLLFNRIIPEKNKIEQPEEDL